jgi:hypothetical protein
MPGYYEAMSVDLPEGQVDGLRIDRFTVAGSDYETFRAALHGRPISPGTYTRLMDGGRLWMSDTPAEKCDHLEAVWKIAEPGTRRVLINGLGIGMVLKAALAYDHIEHIDVVEIDPRVIELVGPHYADPRVTIHQADAYEQCRAWPRGTRWDAAWSDIWPNLCTSHLADMARLRRSYGRRTTWHDCWGRELLLAHRAQERRQGW